MDGESHSTVWSKLGSFFSGKSSEDHLEQAIREAREDGWLCDDSRIKGELEFFPVVSELSVGMEEAVKGYRAEGLL